MIASQATIELVRSKPSDESADVFADLLARIDKLSEELSGLREKVAAVAVAKDSVQDLQYLTDKQVAALLQISAETVRNRCKKGLFSGAINLEGRAGWRIPRASVGAEESPGVTAPQSFDPRRLSDWRRAC